MQKFGVGVRSVGIGVRVFVGRFTGIGRRVGIPIHQRFALMFSTSLIIRRANQDAAMTFHFHADYGRALPLNVLFTPQTP
jgi:hypothetical protein